LSRRSILLPQAADGRHIPIEAPGRLEAFAFDPSSITLIGMDRGFDLDLEDVAFRLRHEWMDADSLETFLICGFPDRYP
jgi:hypothetical protein